MDIAQALVRRSNIPYSVSASFVRQFFETIQEALLREKIVKVRGLGTFKLVSVEPRESVSVVDGSRIQIAGHTKVSFTPDAVLRDAVNKPFAEFETVSLSENLDLSLLDTLEDDETMSSPNDTRLSAANTSEDVVVADEIGPETSDDETTETSEKASAELEKKPEEMEEAASAQDNETNISEEVSADHEEGNLGDNPSEKEEETPEENPSEKEEDAPEKNPAEKEEETPEENPSEKEEDAPEENPAEKEEETPEEVCSENTGDVSEEDAAPVVTTNPPVIETVAPAETLLEQTSAESETDDSSDDAGTLQSEENEEKMTAPSAVEAEETVSSTKDAGAEETSASTEEEWSSKKKPTEYLEQMELEPSALPKDPGTSSKPQKQRSGFVRFFRSLTVVLSFLAFGALCYVVGYIRPIKCDSLERVARVWEVCCSELLNFGADEQSSVESAHAPDSVIVIPIDSADFVGQSEEEAKAAPAPKIPSETLAYPQLEEGDYWIVGIKGTEIMKPGKTLLNFSLKYYNSKDFVPYICVMNDITNPDVVPLNKELRIPELRKK
ncbi:MAG: HU family DNA-binding protein [Bacteroidaceae bacterium]|nr:HU family DNA-binding protein [Bacteroidaceae bacterium]